METFSNLHGKNHYLEKYISNHSDDNKHFKNAFHQCLADSCS